MHYKLWIIDINAPQILSLLLWCPIIISGIKCNIPLVDFNKSASLITRVLCKMSTISLLPGANISQSTERKKLCYVLTLSRRNALKPFIVLLMFFFLSNALTRCRESGNISQSERSLRKYGSKTSAWQLNNWAGPDRTRSTLLGGMCRFLTPRASEFCMIHGVSFQSWIRFTFVNWKTDFSLYKEKIFMSSHTKRPILTFRQGKTLIFWCSSRSSFSTFLNLRGYKTMQKCLRSVYLHLFIQTSEEELVFHVGVEKAES